MAISLSDDDIEDINPLYINTSLKRKRLLRRTAFYMAVLYIVVSMIMFVCSAMKPNVETNSRISNFVVASHFGLESDKAYPLNLGSRFASTSGQLSVEGGLFYLHSEGRWTSTTAISLGFRNTDRHSWVLEIPMDRTTFIQNEVTEPSVKIILQEEILLRERTELGTATKYYPDCSLQIKFGWWVCERGDPHITYSASDNTERAGLPPVIAEAFADGNASAEITLTPEQYTALPNG